MKQWITGILVCLSLLACSKDNKQENTEKTGLETSDPVVFNDAYKEAIATKMDIIFDDFLLTFSLDSALQWNRICFPLPFTDGKEKAEISSDDWRMNHFFGKEHIHTAIFNTEEELDLPSRTDLQEASVERIDIDKKTVKQYHFQRNAHKAWTLCEMKQLQVPESSNADFLSFYTRFASDSEYRKAHIQDPLTFVTNYTDSDDGFGTDQFTMEAEQWMAWDVTLPTSRFTNIVYGPHVEDKDPSVKIFCIKDMDGGYFRALHFRKKKGEWKLQKYEDTGY